MAFKALAILLLASPVLAFETATVAPVGDAPAEKQYVDPSALKARAEALRDAVADTKTSDISVKSQAYGFFDKLPTETLVVATPKYRRMEREAVTGEKGSIEGMQAAAKLRVDEWKRTHTEPPSPSVLSAMNESASLQGDKRLSYDSEGKLDENQMGLFKYMRDSLTGGIVKLNDRMKILGILVGDAFTYATVAHESQHSLDCAAGLLTPEEEIKGEIRAFRTQYDWLKLMDPSGEKMLTLHGSLKMWMLREPVEKIKLALNDAVTYLEHLSDVVETNGKEDELKKLVIKLGYADPHSHSHDGAEDAHKGRGAASPTSA